MNITAVDPGLSAVLPAYLARQRWFGSKHRGSDVEVRVTALDHLTESPMALDRLVLEVDATRYQLLLGRRPVADAGDVAPDAIVGRGDTSHGPVVWFDALADADLSLEVLHRVAPGVAAEGVRPVAGEQSNTSLVFDERVIVKVFRRLVSGNPEIEVAEALARGTFAHVPELLGVWRAGRDDLAVAQRFIPGGADGWALALASVRDVLDEGLDPAEAGGDLAPEAARLGVMTAEMHVALADAFGVLAGDPVAWADAAIARAAAVSDPRVDRADVVAVLETLRGLRDAGAAIRIHGDFHLGQVMRTDDGWFVLDFEGEPSRPVEERTARASPLRDVAGMLRSFGYAAAVGLRASAGGDPVLASAWEERNRGAYLDAYLSTLAGSALVPRDAAVTARALWALELDKAVYEVAYEQGNRPDWVDVPLAAVQRLLEST